MALVRINKFLSQSGIASRRKVDEYISSNRVKVNGKTISEFGIQVDSEKDIITLDGKVIKPQAKQYFILNKPKNYVCSNLRKDREKLVIDIFSKLPYKLFTVGRLDRDTTGLIIVTNDGDLSNQIIHPSSDIEKEYIAKVKETLTETHLKKISKGAFVENKFVKPKKVVKIHKNFIKIIVKEGKKREVKEFIKQARLKLMELTRTRIGNLKLHDLKEGQYVQVGLKALSPIFSKFQDENNLD